MRNLKIGFFVSSMALAGVVGCGDDDAGDDDTVTPDAAITADADTTDADPLQPDAGPMNVDVTGSITADTTWTYPNTYFLKSHVFVKNGATLTIEPGVIVKGDALTSLVITREGKIDAAGTAARPIVFTSVKPEGQAKRGDWGGIVLLGKAKINDTAGELGIEGFPEGTADVKYGGTDDAHDCGTLKYVRIEFPGFVLENNKELNGLSVGACGSGTELDFIQVHNSSDDGVEFFGGTVSIKHLIASSGIDDGMDWDFGWTGKAQFVIVQIGNGDGEHGFEGDNHPTNFTLTPISKPVIYNTTIVGPDAPTGKAKRGMMIRTGGGAQVHNAIVFNVSDMPVDVDQTSNTQTPTNLFVRNSIFFQNGAQVAWNDDDGSSPAFDEGAYFRQGTWANLESNPNLTAATSLTAPSFKPMAGSPALTVANAAVPPSDGFFDASATFIGAIGADDWTAGWTAFPTAAP